MDANNGTEDTIMSDTKETIQTEAKKPKKKAMFIGLTALTILVVAAIAYYLLLGPATIFRPDIYSRQSVIKHEEIGPIVSLDPFIFNVNGTNSGGYVKITIGFELTDPKIVEKAKQAIPAVRDKSLSIMSTYDMDTFIDAGKRDMIKNALLAGINELYGHKWVKKVFIMDIIVQ